PVWPSSTRFCSCLPSWRWWRSSWAAEAAPPSSSIPVWPAAVLLEVGTRRLLALPLVLTRGPDSHEHVEEEHRDTRAGEQRPALPAGAAAGDRQHLSGEDERSGNAVADGEQQSSSHR